MNFKHPYEFISDIPTAILEQTLENVIKFEKDNIYTFRWGDWERLDSYHSPNKYKFTDVAGVEILNYVTGLFPDDKIFGWSLSKLPGGAIIKDHTDKMMFHRFCKRIIICISDTPDVLNWHWSTDKVTKRPYLFKYGNIYELNTAVTHGVKNSNKMDRYAVYFDMIPQRLLSKFGNHADIRSIILSEPAGEKYVL